jgi:hypothetical protein
MADARTDALVKSVGNLLKEKQAVAEREKVLVQALNTVLTKMGYAVVPRGPAAANGRRRRRRLRGPGRPRGSRNRTAAGGRERPPKAQSEAATPRRRGRPPKAAGQTGGARRRGRPPKAA